MKGFKYRSKFLALQFLAAVMLSLIITTHASAQLVAGIDTVSIVDGQWQYYDFTSQTTFTIADTATYTPDFRGSSNEGVNFGQEFSQIIPPRRLLLLGTGNIDTVTTVPEWTDAAPWVDTSWDWPNGTQGQPISPGQLWVVYTSEGLYAVMQIDELPDGNFGSSFTFKYKYMSEGGTTLEESNLIEESGDQIVGNTTLNSGNGFDLSGESNGELEDAGTYEPDFVFVNNEGVNFGNEGSTSLSSTGRRFLLLGNGNLDSLTTVPTRTDAAPWVSVSYDFSDGTGGQPISVGQLWAVYTREGNYAAIEITALPGGGFGQSFDFKYKYQPNGSTNFEADTTIVDPDPTYSMAIVSGDSQTVAPTEFATQTLQVNVSDENGSPISGEEVGFSFILQPQGTSNNGVVSTLASTDANGVAQAQVSGGDAVGEYQIQATLQSDTTAFVVFSLFVDQPDTASGDLILGSATSTHGTGFDFSRQETGDNEDAGDYMLDFAFVNNEGVNFGNEGSTSLSGTGRRFLLLGNGNLDSLTTIPERSDAAPWVTVSYDFADGTGGQPISVGQLWAVYTREGNYAAIEITALPGGNFGSSFDFKYKYQPNGSRFFEGDTITTPEPILSIAIEDGNNQTVEPSAYAPITLQVQVTNQDNEAVSGEEVRFSFSAQPAATTTDGIVSELAVTNASGFAHAQVGAGNAPGEYQIQATLNSDTTKFVTFSLYAEETDTIGGETISGTATSTNGTGFDFSRQETGDNEDAGEYQLDFAFVNNEGVNFGNESSGSLAQTGRRFLLLGEGSLESVNEAPTRVDEAPWVTVSYDFADGTGGQPISVGQLWAVFTREEHYAVMEITGLPDGNFGNSFTFDYKYQPSGSNQFGDVEPQVPDTMIIASGDNQTGVVNTTVSEPLMVQVLDQNELPMEGVTVNFSITNQPEGADGAEISESSVITNSEGHARVVFTLSDKVGEYVIEASAENLNSVTFTVTAEELSPPDAVTLLSIRDGFVENSLMPEWSQSTAEDFLYYKVYMAVNDGELQFVDSTRVGTGFRQDTAKAIFDLENFEEYTFAVSVVNTALLESELSNQLTGMPTPSPEEIQNFTATAGDGAVQLSWSPIDTSYFGFYDLTINTREGELVKRDSIYHVLDTTYVIGDLENDAVYTFLINGVNAFGKAGFSSFASAVPKDSYVEEEITLPNLVDGSSSWADVDGDGDMDLLMTGRLNANSDPETHLFLNDGTGEFTNSNQNFVGLIYTTVFWQDIDQNGFVDVLITGQTDDGNVITKVYLNNEGTFTDAELILPAYTDGMISPADFDNDGDIDLLVAGDTGTEYTTALLVNNGNQSFEPLPYDFIGFSKASAAWGDFNADGFLDFVIAGELQDGAISTTVYQNIDGNSFFVKEGTFQGVISGAVAFADLDVDGDLDLLISGYKDSGKTTHFTGLYHYNGLDFELFYSVENPPAKTLATVASKSTLQLGDFDNDGDPDVLLNTNASVSILKNKRTAIEETTLEISGSSVTWADYDGDGDLDIVASGADGARVLANTTAIVNTPPTTPANAMVSVMMDSVSFTWDASTDAQTPANILSYNLRVGTAPGLSDVLSANANLATGKLFTQTSGNAGQQTKFKLSGLANGTYYWQVQAVDNAFAGSAFSAEQSFTVDNSPVHTEQLTDSPLEFELKQNYPNPFNPSTVIEFAVPVNGHVNLEIYDINGRKVQELVNESLAAGSYSATFNASNLASGLYIYRLRTGANVLTRKMTLIK